jgi:uncharacterized protein DUF4331
MTQRREADMGATSRGAIRWWTRGIGAAALAGALLASLPARAADHRDGPVFGLPGITITNSRRDINDLFVFRSPSNANNTVFIATESPFSTATTPATFDHSLAYEFRVALLTSPLVVNDDIIFRVTFGPPDGTGVQDVTVRGIPGARFPPNGILAQGKTGQNLPVRGGGQFRAAEQDDPFRFDAAGFDIFLDRPTAVAAVQAGVYPRGTSPNGFGPGSTPNFDAPNFFGPSVNTLAIVLEVPSAIIAPTNSLIGVWFRTELDGLQLDRMGRPGINIALIPPVPRGSNFPANGSAPNRVERRNAFNAGHPADDRVFFRADMVSVLTAFYPAGRPGGNPNAAQAGVVADLLLPDLLVFQIGNTAGFGTPVNAGGNTFLGNGRRLSDDVISTELAVVMDDDLPAAFGGGPNPPAIVTQNVKDDNGSNLTDGSTNPPPPLGTGAAGPGTVRGIAFPYIGARIVNPSALPGPPPPP